MGWAQKFCHQLGRYRLFGNDKYTVLPWYVEALAFGFGARVPEILQVEAAECGLACLAMISSYHQRYTELSDLRRAFPISSKGVDLLNLISIAHQLNLSSRALRLELNQLHMLKLPCILHWNFDHFVVLTKVERDHIIILDPAVGMRRLHMNEVSKCFTGVGLELWPSPDFRAAKKENETHLTASQLIKSTTGLLPLFMQVIILALGIELLTLLAPIMTQLVVDYVTPSRDDDLLTTCGIGFCVVVLLQQTLIAMRSWVVMYMSTTLALEWQANTFSHLIRLPITYFQNRHLGDLVSRFDSVKQIQNTLTGSFITAVLDGIMSIATLALMFVYSAWLAWVALAAISLYVVLRVFTFSYLRGNTQSKIVFDAKAQTSFLETLRGIRAIKLFQREDLRRMRWLSLLVQGTNSGLATQRTVLIFSSVHGLLFGVERVAALWLGAKMILAGNMTVGVLMAYISYLIKSNLGAGLHPSLINISILECCNFMQAALQILSARRLNQNVPDFHLQ